MQAKLIIGAIVLSMAGALWFSISSAAEAKSESRQWKEQSEALAKQVAKVAEDYTKLLKSQEKAYHVRDSIIDAGAARREVAEKMASNDTSVEVLAWRHGAVPDSIADGVCLKAGSCIVPASPIDPEGSAETGAGDAAGRKIRLSNDSLRAGVEALRRDLAVCNGQLAGIAAWEGSQND